MLSLATISLLHRHAVLAKSLKLKMREYLALRLAGRDLFESPRRPWPSSAGAPGQGVAVQDCGARLPVPPSLGAGQGAAPAEDATLLLLEALQKELLKIVADTQPVEAPTIDILRAGSRSSSSRLPSIWPRIS